MITFAPLCDAFGVLVRGLDIETLAESDKKDLRQAFLTEGLLLLRGLPLTLQQHIVFSRVFGNLELHPIESIRHREAPEIIILEKSAVSEDDPEAEKIGGKLPWHTDLIYTAAPSRGAVLCPIVIPPEGGQTGWIDTAKVYAALPDATKQRIAGLKVVHCQQFARMKTMEPPAEKNPGRVPKAPLENVRYGEVTQSFPEVIHPLVYTHVGTGEPVLNVSPWFARKIVGIPDEEGATLLSELQDFATQRQFTYVHDWKPGDVVIWNNWRTMHCAFGCKGKYGRVMHRTTIEGSALPLAMAA